MCDARTQTVASHEFPINPWSTAVFSKLGKGAIDHHFLMSKLLSLQFFDASPTVHGLRHPTGNYYFSFYCTKRYRSEFYLVVLDLVADVTLFSPLIILVSLQR